jgi:hypothetical protein
MKDRSSYKVQREFPAIRKRFWGCRFWGRGYFSTSNGAITEDIFRTSKITSLILPASAGCRSVLALSSQAREIDEN